MGFSSDMISTLKRNRKLMVSKKNQFRENKLVATANKTNGRDLNEPDLTKAELASIKAEIRSQIKQERIKFFLRLLVSIILIIFALLAVIYIFFLCLNN